MDSLKTPSCDSQFDTFDHKTSASKNREIQGAQFFIFTLLHLFLYKISINQRSPGGGGACPYQQRSEDLSQRVCVQAIAGLRLGDLGEVCEKVLQGETVMERDGGGALEDQAYLSVMASSDCTIWKRYS